MRADLLAPLTQAPERSALLFDVDGTLAPIVPRPELAAVPDATRAELGRLVARYRLVACVSGRAGENARAVVGVDGIECVGNHGLELDERAAQLAALVASFRREVAWPAEDKVLSLSYHFREARDDAAARAELEAVAERARSAGLVPRWGRKVLEIRPPVPTDKGTAVTTLIGRVGATRALYAGDDETDLDAFRGLDRLDLEHALRVAVASEEAPAALRQAADLVVESPLALAEVLRLL